MKNKIIAVAILICLNIIQLTAQYASIRGIITGEEEREGLVGVNILLKGTVHGTVSGIHGDYILRDIPAGEQTLIFSYIGYDTYEVPMEFKEGEEKEFNLVLLPGSIDLSAVSVEARQPFSAASSKAIRDFDLKIKPVRSAQDMLLLVPGLFIAQHAGGGKAEQIFMRGFDADHGTDVGISVDGMPVNMVSHGHGQGYADLHFVIPEIIDGMTVFKGPYFSQYGNFGTAGSVTFTTTDHPDHNLVKLEGGMFNTAKATAVLKIPTTGKHQSAYLAGQYYHSDGPFESPQGFNRANIYGKFHTHITPRSELGIVVGAFSSAWDASGQIPQRAIDEELITRWGAIDDMEGGITGRYNISVDYHFMEGYEHDFMVQAFVSKYDFKLYSNFTFWLNDSIDGDMIEQSDHRTIYGINTNYSLRKTLGRIRSLTKVGGSYRGDNMDVSLWKSPDRIRKSVRTDNNINEVNMAFWLEEDLVFSQLFKLQLGLRGDYFTFHSIDHLDYPEFPGNGLPHASGYAQSTILSPKLNMVLSPASNFDLYLNMGTGFHSNDARDVIIAQRSREIIHAREKQGVDPAEIEHELLARNLDPAQRDIKTLPRAAGVELGTRFSLGTNILISLAGWYLHMEEELVFVGDEGSTEISGETRRKGLDAEIRMQLARWIWVDVDLNLSDGRYVNEPVDANYIPLAPRIASQGGINFLHPAGIEAAVRYRYLGDRPANQDNSVVATGHFLNNIILAYKFRGFRVFTQLENLYNITWNEAQFDTESRLFYETVPVSELHFTPGNPFNVQVGFSYEF
jgi:outer membrane receptor protein involved in Fe transport